MKLKPLLIAVLAIASLSISCKKENKEVFLTGDIAHPPGQTSGNKPVTVSPIDTTTVYYKNSLGLTTIDVKAYMEISSSNLAQGNIIAPGLTVTEFKADYVDNNRNHVAISFKAPFGYKNVIKYVWKKRTGSGADTIKMSNGGYATMWFNSSK